MVEISPGTPSVSLCNYASIWHFLAVVGMIQQNFSNQGEKKVRSIFNFLAIFFEYSACSELSNKHAANLILFVKFFPPTWLIRTFNNFMLIYFRGKFPPTRLLEPPRLFILGEIPSYKIILCCFRCGIFSFCLLSFPQNERKIYKLRLKKVFCKSKHRWLCAQKIYKPRQTKLSQFVHFSLVLREQE